MGVGDGERRKKSWEGALGGHRGTKDIFSGVAGKIFFHIFLHKFQGKGLGLIRERSTSHLLAMKSLSFVSITKKLMMDKLSATEPRMLDGGVGLGTSCTICTHAHLVCTIVLYGDGYMLDTVLGPTTCALSTTVNRKQV